MHLRCSCFCLPGTISAVILAVLLSPPSRTMELGSVNGVQAVWSDLASLWLCLIKMMSWGIIICWYLCVSQKWNQKQIQIWCRLVFYYWEAPHIVEGSPASVSCNPWDARVKGVRRSIFSPTDDQPSPRQEGEAVFTPRSRKIGDEAGVGGRAREQLHIWKVVVAIIAADHHLPWCRSCHHEQFYSKILARLIFCWEIT